ncbi:hypothetical protein DEJ50_20100 [Streptomyces venezuelae]|uniref:Uncharacterized protein n=1 Tax=Streptomyces venezuelae TaxID=54571 RepID=A0A5P2D3P0_STRVZ|nr:hypothetical protein [Streptomyces venezuelae]QES49774.1 hypothetical protein DEJ50_20100 [Streptomyces venezuelae]
MSEQQPNPYASEPGPAGSGQDAYKWGPGNPSYGYPQPYPSAPQYQPTVAGAGLTLPGGYAGGPAFSLGDITIAGDQIITPSGAMPLKGAMWNATDFSRTEEKIPTHAIVLAIVFAFFCLIGLLFLLMKERVTTGYVQVTVSSAGRHHSTMIPVTNPAVFPWVMGQVNYARSLSI